MKYIIITIAGFSITFIVRRLSAFSLETLYFRCLQFGFEVVLRVKTEIIETSLFPSSPSLFLIKWNKLFRNLYITKAQINDAVGLGLCHALKLEKKRKRETTQATNQPQTDALFPFYFAENPWKSSPQWDWSCCGWIWWVWAFCHQNRWLNSLYWKRKESFGKAVGWQLGGMCPN